MIKLDQLAPRSRWNAPRLRRDLLDDFNRRACFGATPLLCCCCGLACGLLLCLLCTLPALAAHLVGIPAVITHHLKALVWNVLRDRCDKITRAEHLKVALDLRVHSRSIENFCSFALWRIRCANLSARTLFINCTTVYIPTYPAITQRCC